MNILREFLEYKNILTEFVTLSRTRIYRVCIDTPTQSRSVNSYTTRGNAIIRKQNKIQSLRIVSPV